MILSADSERKKILTRQYKKYYYSHTYSDEQHDFNQPNVTGNLYLVRLNDDTLRKHSTYFDDTLSEYRHNKIEIKDISESENGMPEDHVHKLWQMVNKLTCYIRYETPSDIIIVCVE